MKGFIIGVAIGEREYTINGVKYVVEARYQPRQTQTNIADRIKKFITSDFAHLSVGANDDIIEAENVCSGCEAFDDARKED